MFLVSSGTCHRQGDREHRQGDREHRQGDQEHRQGMAHIVGYPGCLFNFFSTTRIHMKKLRGGWLHMCYS